MKKEYKSPVAEQVPLLMEQSLCEASIVRYMLITGEVNGTNPTVFDDDSD